MSLNAKNFENKFIFNDENLVRVLKSLGKFRYIPNPGNLGDSLIASATYQFFERYNLSDCITFDKRCETVVYGGGALGFKLISRFG